MTEPATKHESDSHHLEHDLSLTQSFLRVTLEIVFWIFDTYDNNLEITNDFGKYLKECCW